MIRRPWMAPMAAATQQTDDDRRPPRPVVRGADKLRHDDRAHRADEADRQVDLAEQQREHLGQPEQDEERRLHEQVRDVPAEMNFEFWVWKMMTIATSPSTIGRTPLSPLRILRHHAPTILAERVGAAPAGASGDEFRRWLTRAPQVGVAAAGSAVRSGGVVSRLLLVLWPSESFRCRMARSPLPFAARAGDVPVVMYSTTLWRVEVRCRPGGDDMGRGRGRRGGRRPRRRRSGCARSPCTVTPRSARRLIRSSTMRGLGDAERRGGLVHDDQLGLGHHRLGDGHRLALPTRQRGHRLADGLHGGHARVRPGSRAPRSPSWARRADRDAAPRGQGTCSGRCRGCRTGPGPGRSS